MARNTIEDASATVTVEVTPQMVEVGIKALREWLGSDARLLVWDHLAVHDVFVAMYESYRRSPSHRCRDGTA